MHKLKRYLSHNSHIGSHRMYLRMCNGKDMDLAPSSNILIQPETFNDIRRLNKKIVMLLAESLCFASASLG